MSLIPLFRFWESHTENSNKMRGVWPGVYPTDSHSLAADLPSHHTHWELLVQLTGLVDRLQVGHTGKQNQNMVLQMTSKHRHGANQGTLVGNKHFMTLPSRERHSVHPPLYADRTPVGWPTIYASFMSLIKVPSLPWPLQYPIGSYPLGSPPSHQTHWELSSAPNPNLTNTYHRVQSTTFCGGPILLSAIIFSLNYRPPEEETLPPCLLFLTSPSTLPHPELLVE
jgi:hypothetical protein